MDSLDVDAVTTNRTWKQADVLALLEANKGKKDLDDNDIEDYPEIQNIPEYEFLKLTEEKLVAPSNKNRQRLE